MKHWPVQDAKARFSAFLKASLTEGPQIVTMRGVKAAVPMPVSEWRHLQRAAPSLKSLLLADEPRRDLDIPARGQLRRRVVSAK